MPSIGRFLTLFFLGAAFRVIAFGPPLLAGLLTTTGNALAFFSLFSLHRTLALAPSARPLLKAVMLGYLVLTVAGLPFALLPVIPLRFVAAIGGEWLVGLFLLLALLPYLLLPLLLWAFIRHAEAWGRMEGVRMAERASTLCLLLIPIIMLVFIVGRGSGAWMPLVGVTTFFAVIGIMVYTYASLWRFRALPPGEPADWVRQPEPPSPAATSL